jgi:predicted ribosomally synthesized peptide with SipW-like signal peptide
MTPTHNTHRERRRPIAGILGRGAVGVSAVVATAALALGITMALFSATQTSESNAFTAGTVSVGLGTESVTCEVAQIMPGDSSAGHPTGSNDLDTCVYDVRYTGNAPAWLAVDVLVESGSPSLYTGTASGFQVLLAANGSLNLIDGTIYREASGTPAAVVADTVVSNLLLSTTPAEQGDAIRFDLDYLLPSAAPNSLQGGDVTVTLTFHAVQSDNQPIGSCVAGRQCNTITWG